MLLGFEECLFRFVMYLVIFFLIIRIFVLLLYVFKCFYIKVILNYEFFF